MKLDPLQCYGGNVDCDRAKCLMCVPTTSTVAKARLVLTARASFLSRYSVGAEFTKPALGYNTMVCADARRNLSFSCLVAGPWGSAVVSAPPVHWDHPQTCALKVTLESMSLPWWGGGWGGGNSCGGREITHVGGRAIPSAWRGRDRHRGAEAASRFFPSGSATLLLWWFRLPPQASHLQSSSFPPVHSGCLLTGNHSPLPGSALRTPCFSTQSLSASEDTLSGCVGSAGVSSLHTGLTLSSTLVAVFSSHRERGSPSVPTELPK